MNSPASEPTNEEIAEALRIMGERCICPGYGGTALYHYGTIETDCAIHGKAKRRWDGLDISKWQINDDDVIKITAVMGEAIGNSIDRNIMNEAFKGTISYGQELGEQGQEAQEIEVRDAGPGPVYLHSEESDGEA